MPCRRTSRIGWYALLNEAAHCLAEDIVDDADLVDAGVIFGTGFAPFRGGPLHYARTQGIDTVVARLKEFSEPASVHASRRLRAGTSCARCEPDRLPRPKSLWLQYAALLKCRCCVHPHGSSLPANRRMTGTPLTIENLRRFTPLDSLKRENIAALAKKIQSHQLDSGKTLFREGDADRRTYLPADRHAAAHQSGRWPQDSAGRQRRGPQPGVADAAPPLDGQGRGPGRVHLHRHRPARRHADLGPDRQLRSTRPEHDTDRAGARRLDDHPASDQGVPPRSAGEYPGGLHAHAEDELQRRRSDHQAGRRRRLFLRHHARPLQRHPRDAAEQGRHQARRTWVLATRSAKKH